MTTETKTAHLKEASQVRKLLGALAVMFYSALVRGYVILMLWKWFVTPAFGLASIRFVTTFGLGCLFAVVRGVPDHKKSEPEEENSAFGRAAILTIYYGTLLVFAYTVVLLSGIRVQTP